MASITLPRPSRKGNLANVVISNLLSSNPTYGKKTKEKEREREYQGTYPARRNSAVLAYGLYGRLSGSKACTKNQ